LKFSKKNHRLKRWSFRMIALAGFIKRSAICFKSALQNYYLIKSLLSIANYTGIIIGIT